MQWLWSVPLRGRSVVCVNVDETPIYRQHQPRKGYVVTSQKKRDLAAYARVPLRDRRGQATMLGCLVDDPELQRYMPQFFLTNHKTTTRAEKTKLSVLPPPLQWVHPSTGWVTASILKQLLTRIRRAVREKRPGAEVVLFMDCATIHIADDVLLHCSRLNIHLALIPAGLTYLLQPLDSHVFAAFKRELSETQEHLRGLNADGMLEARAWVDSVSSAVWKTFVEKEWSHSFAENGMLQHWSSLRARIQNLLLGCRFPLALREPNDEELATLVGRRRTKLADLVYRTSRRLVHRPVLLLAPPLARLPPAPPGLRHGSAASSSGGLALPPPPLPPPGHPPPDELDSMPRLTRSGSRY